MSADTRTDPPTEVAWLIERGQPEKQVPTVWWADRKRWGLTYMDDWTEDANKAFRFETREAAEEVIAAKFTPPASRGGPSARAVQHRFIGRTDPPTPDPLTAIRESLEQQVGLTALNYGAAHWREHEPLLARAVDALTALAALPSAPDQRLREAVLFGPVGVTFPNLPHHPTGPDVLDAVAAYMDRQDDRREVESGMYSGFRANRDVQAHLREWATRLRAALSEATTSPEATLDVAWREAEAALPDGWYFTGGSRGHDGYRFVAALGSAPTEAELRRSPQISGIGPTPAAALLTLAARLRGPA